MTPRTRARFGVPLVLALACFAPSLAGAQGIESPRVQLRTAINEINTLRTAYAAAYNQKDAAALTPMYAADAVLLRGDGSTVLGQAAIGKALAAESATWTPTTFSSDTMRVFGNTAWDVDTIRSPRAEGGENVSHYLVVLRRGLRDWKISSVAVVPETRPKSTE